MDIKGKIYLEEEVENKDRKFGENPTYIPTIIVNEDGTEVPALFTKDRIKKAIERAKVNSEDIPERKSFLSRIFG